MDALRQLSERFELNEAEIARLKEQLALREMEQHKLSIAIEVVRSLGSPNKVANEGSQQATQLPRAEAAATPKDAERSVKQLILDEIAGFGGALTKMDVISRLYSAGHHVNAATIGSTLSKLVDADFLEKDGRSAYRIKSDL
jgi:regulator of replication initiation timing